MASTMIVKCECCKSSFTARVADRKRGWARFCSKSCKAIKQTQNGGGKSKLPRHDGKSPMKYKRCDTCGEPAINGVHGITGIEWFCKNHEVEATMHPFSSEALGQW